MSIAALDTPVALLTFNRPEATARVFAEVARARPTRLLVVADGPRPDRPGEAEKCAAARAVIERVDWPCEVLTCYSDTNLGCRRRVSSGLDWVFSTVEEAIILEDDCLPHPTFFRFCEELLHRYRDDVRIAQVSGDNFQFGRHCTSDSYYFSRYTHIWGWATWRRAWRHYDVDMKAWPALRDTNYLREWLGDARTARDWAGLFDAAHGGKIDTWDYQWTFACWSRKALTILPAKNLVSNIGFGTDATHTKGSSPFADLSAEPMPFPLRHPAGVVRNREADQFTERTNYRRPMWSSALAKVASLLSSSSRRHAGATNAGARTR